MRTNIVADLGSGCCVVPQFSWDNACTNVGMMFCTVFVLLHCICFTSPRRDLDTDVIVYFCEYEGKVQQKSRGNFIGVVH